MSLQILIINILTSKRTLISICLILLVSVYYVINIINAPLATLQLM